MTTQKLQQLMQPENCILSYEWTDLINIYLLNIPVVGAETFWKLFQRDIYKSSYSLQPIDKKYSVFPHSHLSSG